MPEGTFSVGTGLIILGLSAYAFLAVCRRAMGAERYDAMAGLWIVVFLAGPGFFIPLEQEVARALSGRRARGVGGGPLIRRAALGGGGLAALLVIGVVAGTPLLRDHLFDGQGLLVLGFGLALAGHFAMHLSRGMLSGSGRFSAYGALLASDGLLRTAMAVALAIFGVKTAGPYGIVLGLTPFVVIPIVLSRQRGLVQPGPEAPWGELSAALGWLLTGSVLAQLLVNSAPLAVTLLASDAESAVAGRFLNGLIVARLPLFLFQAVQAALLPKLARLAAMDRHLDFRSGLKRLVIAVSVICGVGTVMAWAVGPSVVRLLFGPDFDLGRRDLFFLALASAAYVLALALAQALIALASFARVAAGWLVGIVTFVVAAVPGGELLPRIENAFLVACSLCAATMAVGLWLRMREAVPDTAEPLFDALEHEVIEP